MKSGYLIFANRRGKKKKKIIKLCFCHHGGSCSFLELKMINQCCIEFFCRHVQEGLSSCRRFPRNWQITLMLKARDEKQQQQQQRAWMMVKWLLCSHNDTGRTDETQKSLNISFLLFISFSYYYCCCFHMSGGLHDAEAHL